MHTIERLHNHTHLETVELTVGLLGSWGLWWNIFTLLSPVPLCVIIESIVVLGQHLVRTKSRVQMSIAKKRYPLDDCVDLAAWVQLLLPHKH